MNNGTNYKQWGTSSTMSACYVQPPQNIPMYHNAALSGSSHGYPGHFYIAVPNGRLHQNSIVMPRTDGGQVVPNVFQNNLQSSHYNLAPIGAMPAVLPSLSTSTNVPQFNSLYEEFDKRKHSHSAIQQSQAIFGNSSDRYQPQHSLGQRCDASTTPDTFVAAMKTFMNSYEPTACFESKTQDDDWGKEAQALLDEIATFGQSDAPKSSYWPDSKQTKDPVGPERSSSLHNHDDTFTGESSEEHPSSGSNNIQQHILKITPSPYPGGSAESSKISSTESPGSCDGDADDEATSTSISANTTSASDFYQTSKGGTIGHRLKRCSYNSDSTKGLRYPESGYVSSSTDGGNFISRRRGSQSSTTGMDSDDVSSVSSRSTSPSRVRYQYNVREFGAVSPTKVDPYVSSMLAAPWLNTAQTNPTRAGRMTSSSPHNSCPVSEQPFIQRSGADNKEVYQKHKKWITEDILEMIAVRDRLYKRMKKHPAPDIVDMYKKVRNMVVGMTRNAKRVYEKKMEDSRNERAGLPFIPRERDNYSHRRTSTYTKRK